MDIDYESLRHAVLDVLDDSIINNYDIEVVLKSATLVWDNTAVQVKSKDFVMVFDLIDYSLQNYEGLDA